MRKTLSQEIIWWELNRLLFNFIMLPSGLLIFVVVNKIRPVDPHKYGQFYSDIIFTYGLFANILYTIGYIYLILLFKMFYSLSDNQNSIRLYTRRFIIIAGLVVNIIAGLLETLYRLVFMPGDGSIL